MAYESDIVRRMMATLNAIDGVYCIRTHGSSFQQKGTPDVMGCAYGYFFAIEAKRAKQDKPSPAQIYNLKQFKQAGGMTFVSRDPKVKEVVQWIDNLPR